MDLYFFNHYGVGDLFESREFILDIMNLIKVDNYYYAHSKHSSMFFDFNRLLGLNHVSVKDDMDMRKLTQVFSDRIYINTWIGQDSRYVINPVGCVLEKNYEMYNDALKTHGLELSKDVYDYLPGFLTHEGLLLDNVYKFIDEHKDRFKVIICNGQVQSNQSSNFDFTPSINNLCELFPEDIFIITHPIESKYDNLFYSGDIIQNNQGFDLNELSILGESCNAFIGRKSGPFVFLHTKNTWMDSTKYSLSFTYGRVASHFVLSNHLPLNKYWYPTTQDVDKDSIKAIEVCVDFVNTVRSERSGNE